MKPTLTLEQLTSLGLPTANAEQITTKINAYLTDLTAPQAWQKISKDILTPEHPFPLVLFLFSVVYPKWREQPEFAPAWLPEPTLINTTNLGRFMAEIQMTQVSEFHAWTVTHYEDFWRQMLSKLNIVMQKPPTAICDLSQGLEAPNWLVNAKLNIAASCFTAPANATALVFQDQQQLQTLSYAALNRLSNRVANGLSALGLQVGARIAITMPMTVNAIAIYLGIIKFGGVVVSIADSFASAEMALRLRITNTTLVFTQDSIVNGAKQFPLYSKLTAANAPKMCVIPAAQVFTEILRAEDLSWQDFLSPQEDFTIQACDPMTPCTILFSSGTVGDPKAIPWNHTTAIKAASDAYLHHNIQPTDVLAWPTNLGWMMGPWLIFAALINQASIAVYAETPRARDFGEFIQNAKVTMLGVVPTLVATWRQNHCLNGLDWRHIKAFSSTGECSNAEDMLYLMSRANFKPVIEYCGGTEVGGAYVSSTLLENNCPALFTTPVMGMNFILLDEHHKPANLGEVAIVPPSLGLSVNLLNADHHNIYFANMPSVAGKILRRHGDEAIRLSNGYYCILGRVDDTMNLSGIKISSAEIERVLVGIPDITETAAIAIPPAHSGPTQLIIYATATNALDKNTVQQAMQLRINQRLNPLFKIHDIVLTPELPKTASNKILRRVLRAQYLQR